MYISVKSGLAHRGSLWRQGKHDVLQNLLGPVAELSGLRHQLGHLLQLVGDAGPLAGHLGHTEDEGVGFRQAGAVRLLGLRLVFDGTLGGVFRLGCHRLHELWGPVVQGLIELVVVLLVVVVLILGSSEVGVVKGPLELLLVLERVLDVVNDGGQLVFLLKEDIVRNLLPADVEVPEEDHDFLEELHGLLQGGCGNVSELHEVVHGDLDDVRRGLAVKDGHGLNHLLTLSSSWHLN